MESLNWDLLNQILQLGLQSLLLVVVPALFVIFGALGQKLADWVKAKIGETNYMIVLQVVNAAVNFAEQMGLFTEAYDKKEAALDFAQASLKAKGIIIDLQELDRLIEAAVMENFNNIDRG